MQRAPKMAMSPMVDRFDRNLPRWIRVRQKLYSRPIEDVAKAVAEEFQRPVVASSLRPGMRVALAVGSRGIDRLAEIVKAVVGQLRARGCDVVIFPAMGSHGGATPEGQLKVLAEYGVTPEAVGAPIDARMDVDMVGRLEEGMPLYQARAALEADCAIPIARVKMHTAFRGRVESGLAKMLVIGMGKHEGAIAAHAMGMPRFSDIIPRGAELILERTRVPFGVAVVEDGHHRVAHVEVVPARGMLAREEQLLEMARAWMPRILADEFEVLIVDEIGKEISGDGMDPNVTGRFNVSTMQGSPSVERLVVLRLTKETGGNAIGLGAADITTRKVWEAIDFAATYTNALTARVLGGAKVPVVATNDFEAILIAFNTLVRRQPDAARGVRIKNTAQIEEVWVTEPFWRERQDEGVWEPLGPPCGFEFDENGDLLQYVSR